MCSEIQALRQMVANQNAVIEELLVRVARLEAAPRNVLQLRAPYTVGDPVPDYQIVGIETGDL